MKKQEQLLVSSLVKPASQLRGLTFGNKIDGLLQDGLISKTLTFLYGENVNVMMNLLCANALRVFGGKTIFIDAATSFDPYMIVQYAPLKSEKGARKFIESIVVSRAFTCYQLRKLVSSKLIDIISKEGNEIKSVFVSGISSIFNEQDNTQVEINRLELLMASSLRKIASDKKNGVLFVVVSSKTRSENFVMKADTAIKLFHEEKKEKAILMKHYARQFKTISL